LAERPKLTDAAMKDSHMQSEADGGVRVQRVVSRHPLHWMIIDSDESVWLIRRKLAAATERPLTDHERIIGLLCEQLMAANK